MSLTHPYRFTERKIKNIIKENIPDKRRFYSTDGTLCFNTKRECVVPYELDCAYTASVTGTAFDYLARFLIAQKITDNKDKATENLVAQGILKQKKSMENLYESVLCLIEAFIYSQEPLNDEIIEACISLAKMEQVSRAGTLSKEIPYYSDTYYPVKKDLKNLANSFEKTFLPMVQKNSVVVFNPHFGIGSRIAGGADADVYIDGTLYDFKVTKKNGWSSNDVTQIIGYYFLDNIAKKCNDIRNWLSEYPIARVALYKVRYEEIAYFNINELDRDIAESTSKEICYCYLMHNLLSEKIGNYQIPLSMRELLNNCSEQSGEELEWYEKDKDELSDYEQKRFIEISLSQEKLKKHLDSIDIFQLLKETIKSR